MKIDDHEALTSHPLDGIGDINSTERGSGARLNAGKAPFELIPLRAIAAYYRGITPDASKGIIDALDALGRWQEGGGTECLLEACHALGDGWAECAHVFEYGRRRKYSAWNWAKGMAWSVPLACAGRHLIFGMLAGEVLDPESKLPHRGHVFCNIVMLLTYARTYPEGDDRPKGLL